MTTTTAVPCLSRTPRTDARLRLFCFHHAGGGASFFSSWADRVPPGVDVLPVQLPGREARYREPRFQDAGELVAALGRDLAPYLDEGPWAAYGHSMGALVAAALAAARLRAGGRGPGALFLGAYAAPHLTPTLPLPDHYKDRELARLLVDFGGMDPRFLEQERARLPLVVEAFAGLDDPLVDPARVRAWERYAHDFRLTLVPGGHFFPREEPGPFFARLNRSLARLLGEPAPVGPPAAPG